MSTRGQGAGFNENNGLRARINEILTGELGKPPVDRAFLADLSHDKSARACLPRAGAILAPAQTGAGRLDKSGLLHVIPCPTALGLLGKETDERCTATSIRRFQRSTVLSALPEFDFVSPHLGIRPVP